MAGEQLYIRQCPDDPNSAAFSILLPIQRGSPQRGPSLGLSSHSGFIYLVFSFYWGFIVIGVIINIVMVIQRQGNGKTLRGNFPLGGLITSL